MMVLVMLLMLMILMMVVIVLVMMLMLPLQCVADDEADGVDGDCAAIYHRL